MSVKEQQEANGGQWAECVLCGRVFTASSGYLTKKKSAKDRALDHYWTYGGNAGGHRYILHS